MANFRKRFSMISLAALAALGMTSCGKNENPNESIPSGSVIIPSSNGGTQTSTSSNKPSGKTYDNENDPLVFSLSQVDRVFNPFFSTTGPDGEVVGMTQIGMLGNDKEGKYTYGDKEPVVVKDVEIKSQGENEDQTTTYYFVLKNNIRFSNGSFLTIKDVLFNLYVYLDPAYTGSSTIYSTDIVGLGEYRTQETDEKEQESFNQKFQIEAITRIQTLADTADEIFDTHKTENITSERFREILVEEYKPLGGVYAHIDSDYDKALELFREELESDYTNAMDSYESTTFTDENKNVHKNLFTTDVEQFLYNEGYITWNKKDATLTCSFRDFSEVKNMTKEEAINIVYEDKVPADIAEIVSYWGTSTKLNDYIANELMEEYYANGDKRIYKNISGIKFANMDSSVTVNGVEYKKPEYQANGDIKSDYNEVLSITIKKVDPKAIWNFAFTVAPMYYYSDSEHVKAFDYVENFGVEYSSQKFMNNVVNSADKVGLPVGAGAYAASKSSGGITDIKASEFYDKGVVYYERNPYYLMGSPIIKKVRYQVVAANQMLTTLYSGEIDFVQPNAKPETITELEGKLSEGIQNKSIRTAGYGYIGINASKVPSVKIRQAIMHAINTQECVEYYKNTAQSIYRPMSLSSWAYPKEATPYYPYIGGAIPEDLSVVNPDYAEFVTNKGYSAGQVMSEADQKEFIISLVEGAGYTLNGSGIYQNGSNVCKYVFTIAGEETDHPAWNAMWHAQEVLNKYGFQITCQTDANALKKLSTGDLTVWAAAWGSTIDPDMYQVYHKDSKATSVLNWGYKQILMNAGGKYDYENTLVSELSDLIDQGRQTNDQEARKVIYASALDLVMQLAVELPTYQRDDLFAYNGNKIDVTTLTPDEELSPYKGLTSNLHLVSLVTNKER